MEEHFSHEKRVREYLLGFLSECDGDKIETLLFSDGDFEHFVDLIEDEIIDDYLDGRLPAKERRAVERFFLRPPERRHKLSFARGLRRHLSSQARESPAGPSPPGLMTVPARVWMAMAALVVVAAGLGLYAWKLNRGLQDAITAGQRLQADLLHERGQRESLEQKVEKLALQSTSAQTEVDLFPIERSLANAPFIRRSTASSTIKVHIALTGDLLKSYGVAIKSASDNEIWYVRGLPPSRQDGGSELVFEVPTELLQPGAYTAVFGDAHLSPNHMKTKCGFNVLP